MLMNLQTFAKQYWAGDQYSCMFQIVIVELSSPVTGILMLGAGPRDSKHATEIVNDSGATNKGTNDIHGDSDKPVFL